MNDENKMLNQCVRKTIQQAATNCVVLEKLILKIYLGVPSNQVYKSGLKVTVDARIIFLRWLHT